MFAAYNFRGQPVNTVIGSVPGLTLNQDGNGDYVVTYTVFKDPSDLSGTHYDSAEEETDFADSGDYLDFVEDAFVNVLSYSSAWGVSFADVAKITFEEDLVGNPGYITIGQLTGDHTLFLSQPAGMAFTVAYPEYSSDHHGDIWINVDHSSTTYSGINLWEVDGGTSDAIIAGEYTWTVIHEELAHALGIDIVGTSLAGGVYDSDKYSITSYVRHPDMHYDQSNGRGAYAQGLQLFDIAALQAIYGADTTTRLGDTTYKMGSGEAFGAAASDAFVYTIWDAGGDHDKIDATRYLDGVQIDLREGYFSSIGKNGNPNGDKVVWDNGSYDAGNVAIAHGARIEDATGTAQADHLIGNEYSNILIGGGGNDTLDGGAGNDTANYAAVTGSVTISGNTVTNDGTGGTDTLLNIENVVLGSGNDTLQRTGAITASMVYDGGTGTDSATYSSYPTIIVDARKSGQDTYTLYSANGLYSHTLRSFESFDYNNTQTDRITILPDIAAASPLPFDIDRTDVFLDYSAASSGGSFDIGSFVYFENEVTIGGVTQELGGYISHRGTNFNDYFHIGVSYNATMTVHTGAGDDTVNNLESAGPSSSTASLLNIVYGGGVDTIANAYCVDNVYVWAGLRYEDVTNVSFNWVSNGYDSAVISFIDGQSLALNKLIVDSINTEDTGGGWLGKLRFESGGYIEFLDQGGWNYVSGAPTVSEVRGSWGNDILKSYGTLALNALGGNDTVEGSTGNDTLNGGDGHDLVLALAGNDTVYGGADDDRIDGGAGVDSLFGHSGNDFIAGGAGNDSVDAGDGDDVLIVGDGSDTLTGGNGSDVFVLGASGSGTTIITDFDPTRDTLDFRLIGPYTDYQSFLDLMSGSQLGSNLTLYLPDYQLQLNNTTYEELNAGNLAFAIPYTPPPPVPVLPTYPGLTSESLLGTSGDDVLSAEGLGSDAYAIEGYDGDDTLTGGDGDDVISGGAGSNALSGGSGNDHIISTGFFENLYGGDGDDIYEFDVDEATSVWLNDSGGLDYIVLPDTVFAWDTFFYASFEPDRYYLDIYLGPNQYFSIDFSLNSPSNLYAEGIEYVVVQDIAYDLAWVYENGFQYTHDPDPAPNPNEAPIAKDDNLTGVDSSVLQGNVMISNGSGIDYDGQSTVLTVTTQTGTITALGTFVLSENGNLAVTPFSNITVSAGTFEYELLDDDGFSSTASVSITLSGTDELFTSISGNETFNGRLGIDTVSYAAASSSVTINLTSGVNSGGGGADTFSSIENITGSAYNDILTGDALANALYGNAGVDTITGNAGDDTISGGDGNDTLYGNDGADNLTGGAGADYLWGHAGADALNGEAGGDAIFGLEGNDTAYGGAEGDAIYGDYNNIDESTYAYAGADVLYGDGGNDYLYGGQGADVMHGGTEADVLYGGSGNDTLNGDDGSDTLYGDAGVSYSYSGDDILNGNMGNDTLYGQNGNDLLYAADGADYLYGGTGTNTFRIQNSSDNDNDMAYVQDWSTGTSNVINIVDLLSGYNPGTDNLDHFVSIAVGSNTTIGVDRDGTGSNYTWDNVVRLVGITSLSTDPDVLVANGTLVVPTLI